jgi:hypothetical protein
LHTLQLNGSGVVNGLEVRCQPCGTGVVVGTGYAISPCGDDIVVCCDTAVDVCALIKKCQPPDASCQPYSSSDTATNNCDAVVQDYVLAIRYTETPARGVAALRMGPTCSCGASNGSCTPGTTATCGCGSKAIACSCGATKKSSCGCGAKSTQTCSCGTTQTAKPRTMPAECEPSVICEGYSFDVMPAPQTKFQPKGNETGVNIRGGITGVTNTQLDGALPQNFMCCWQTLVDAIPQTPGDPGPASYNQNPSGWSLWCCRAKQVLIDYFTNGPEADCTIVTNLMKINCPDPQSETFADDMAVIMFEYIYVLLDALLACLCHALLPPAPCGTTDDRIPLAIVSVRKKDCTVVKVCNFTPLRKTVVSFPALDYWFGWLPIWNAICEMIHNLCCGSLFRQQAARMETRGTGTSAPSMREEAVLRTNPTLSNDATAKNEVFLSMLWSALGRGQGAMDPRDLVGSMVGIPFGGKQTLSVAERANAPGFLLLNQVLRPIAASAFGGTPMTAINNIMAPAKDTAGLHERVRVLEEMVHNLRGKK